MSVKVCETASICVIPSLANILYRIEIKIKMLRHRMTEAEDISGGGGGGSGGGVISGGGGGGVVGDGALYPHCILTVSPLYPHFILTVSR